MLVIDCQKCNHCDECTNPEGKERYKKYYTCAHTRSIAKLPAFLVDSDEGIRTVAKKRLKQLEKFTEERARRRYEKAQQRKNEISASRSA